MKWLKRIATLFTQPCSVEAKVPNRPPRTAELISERVGVDATVSRKVFALSGDATANAYLLHHNMGEVIVQVYNMRNELIVVPFMSNDGNTTLLDFRALLAIDLRAVVIG